MIEANKLFQICVQDSINRIESYVGNDNSKINDRYVNEQLVYIDKMYKIFNKTK